MLKQPLERGRRPRPASGRVLTPVAVRAWPTVRSSAPCRRMEWAMECAPSVSFASSGVPSVLSGSEGRGIDIRSALLPCRPPRALPYGPYC